MKILFTFYLATGGVVTLNRHRYHALNSEDCECHFLYLKNGSGLNTMGDARTYVTNDDEDIKALLYGKQYDVIVVTLDFLFVNRLRRLGYKGKIIFDVQGFGTDIKELFDIANDHITGEVDAILSPKTPHLEQLIAQHFPSTPAFHFHNCITFSMFTTNPQSKPKRTIIGWVGRIEENKNWRYFLQIGEKLLKEDPSLELWIFEDPKAANPSEKKHFHSVVKKLKLRNHMRSLQNVPYERMAEFYSLIGRSGGFLCSTSKKEGFGYAVLEAMCCKCPVVCTDSDGIKSFVIDEQTGLIIPHNNVPASVNKAQRLLRDKQLQNQLTSNARNYVHEHFSPELYKEHFHYMLAAIGLKH